MKRQSIFQSHSDHQSEQNGQKHALEEPAGCQIVRYMLKGLSIGGLTEVSQSMTLILVLVPIPVTFSQSIADTC